MSNKKAVVFGGSGFLGSHVADALAGSGHEVTIYDIEPSPYLQPIQKMVVGDILDEDLVLRTVKGSEAVYNFAGISDIDEACKRPLDSTRINILGNSIILEACRKSAVKRFVFASSLYVYSKAGSFYRSTKQACELLIENYSEIFELPYTILRYGSLYGNRADERNFIYKILKQAIGEGRIVRDGDGEEIRDYIHVYDAARSSVEILSEEFINQHVIITGNQQMKIKDLLIMIKEMMQNKIKIEYRPPHHNSHYEITPYTFAPKLAKRILSRTCIDLNEGLFNCMRDMHKEMNH